MLATRQVLFTLASNVAYFNTGVERRMELESRIKQMAILADEIWLEPGTLTVDVKAGMVLPQRHAPDSLSEGEIRKRREEMQRGSPFLRTASQRATGSPRDLRRKGPLLTRS
jgi:hypothetical protein